ncbi:MAG TPA: M42 family metallopeptidase [Solirubrobacteraceae bacterium]|jgi:endoglucanase|nr:M42 family metallopeptidase [Solirubrobacteraceae bacterium]
MAIPQLLDALLRVPGPSGNEARAAAVWREQCRRFSSEVDVDVNGSSWARVPGLSGGPSLAAIGHIDEIGVHITHIDDDGFLRFGQVGGWDPVNLVSQRVLLDTLGGPVHGVIGRKAIHLMDEEDRKKVPELKSLHIDIGAASGDEARERVRIGDTGVIDVEPIEFPNGRVVSRALDNRVGCYVASRAAEIVAEDGGASGDFLALAVVQEEIGVKGAQTAAFRHRPDVAIAIDVTHASDTPGVVLGQDTEHKLGSGPVIQRASLLHPRVAELLYEAAEAESIPYTLSSSSRFTGTDADAFTTSRAGIPTGLVSVPLRYMHSSVEMISIEDLENAAKLVAAVAKRLEPGVSFAR